MSLRKGNNMNEPKMTKVFITARALSDGIIEKDVLLDEHGIGRIEYNTYTEYCRPKDYTLNVLEAHRVADNMRARKIALLKKQIAKLEALKFE